MLCQLLLRGEISPHEKSNGSNLHSFAFHLDKLCGTLSHLQRNLDPHHFRSAFQTAEKGHMFFSKHL